MVYCFGLKAKYDVALASGRPFYKYGRDAGKRGGAVFRTPEDVRVFLTLRGDTERGVYAVDADWNTDTAPIPGEPFRCLVKTSLVMVVSEVNKTR